MHMHIQVLYLFVFTVVLVFVTSASVISTITEAWYACIHVCCMHVCVCLCVLRHLTSTSTKAWYAYVHAACMALHAYMFYKLINILINTCMYIHVTWFGKRRSPRLVGDIPAADPSRGQGRAVKYFLSLTDN